MWDLIVSVPDHCLSFYFVSSAVSVDSSLLETVSVPALSLTSLKFTKWLVLWDD